MSIENTSTDYTLVISCSDNNTTINQTTISPSQTAHPNITFNGSTRTEDIYFTFTIAQA